MTELKEGDLIKDKITGKKYYILKIRESLPERNTPLQKIGGLFADPLREDLFCKDQEGQKGWKYSAEVEKIKK